MAVSAIAIIRILFDRIDNTPSSPYSGAMIPDIRRIPQ
jgi:hypothetical protein